MLMSLNPAQPRLDVEQRGCQPAMPLIRALPVVHLGTALLDQRVDRLESVSGLERLTEQLVHAQALQRQRLLKTVGQARRRRLIALLEFALQRAQSSLRLGIGGALPGPLQPRAPARLLALGQIAHYVLALVPHTALHRSALLKHLAYRRAQPLRLPRTRGTRIATRCPATRTVPGLLP